jgi:fumarylacetoacetate (FAA) hydrolase
MKLATLRNDTRDGRLVVVSRDLRTAAPAGPEIPTMRGALEHWEHAVGPLQCLYERLNNGDATDAFEFDPATAAAPLPRASQWLDGSAFLNHGQLFVTAYRLDRNTQQAGIPLMYQGASDDFLGPCDDVVVPDEGDEIDFEGEIAVVVDDVPMGCTASAALHHIKLITLVNDVSLRAHGMREMKTGFGFIQGKPSTSFAPIAATPDELGTAWRDGRVCLPLHIRWNNEVFGRPDASQMDFSFPQLIAHAARTRRLSASTIIGSGTVSNADRSVGSATISERRVIELLDHGAIRTRFMRFGDRIRIEMPDARGVSIFGAIDQRIAASVV